MTFSFINEISSHIKQNEKENHTISTNQNILHVNRNIKNLIQEILTQIYMFIT